MSKRKSPILLIILAVATLGILFYFTSNRPPVYSWDRYYSHKSTQPYDCQLVDSLLSVSLPNGYRVISYDDFLHLPQTDSTQQLCTYMIRAYYDYYDYASSIVDSLLRCGNNFVICNGRSYGKAPYLYLSTYSYAIQTLKEEISEGLPPDTVYWAGDGGEHPAICIPDELVNRVIVAFIEGSGHTGEKQLLHENARVLAYRQVYAQSYSDPTLGNAPIAIEYYPVGPEGGKLIFCSTPLIFTNYSFVESNGGRELALRLLGKVSDRPIVCVDYTLNAKFLESEHKHQTSNSPLSYVLKHRPLRWALWVALAGVLLALIFTARRKQRVVPVIKTPANERLNFIKHLGALMHDRHDNTGLLAQKHAMFIDVLRNRLMIDIDASQPLDEATVRQLSNECGIPIERLQTMLNEIHASATGYADTSNRDAMRIIDMMNEIQSKL